MSEWQQIETAPKDGTHVALKFENGFEDTGTWRTTYGGEWHVGTRTYLPWAKDMKPTHWHPIP